MAPQVDDDFDAPPTLAEAVAQRLRAEILSGHLASGTPIRDAELASRLGVSITPVREAVAVLISEGLIEVLPNKRRRVTILTQRMAQELMDVVGLVVAASLERVQSTETERTDVAASCRAFADRMLHGDRAGSEPAFEHFIERLLRVAGNEELTRMAAPVVRRAVNVARLYPSEHLYDLWGQTFHRVADLVVEDPASAAALVRGFTGELLAAMSRDRPPLAEVRPAAVHPPAVQPAAVQPAAVQPAAVQPAAVQPVAGDRP